MQVGVREAARLLAVSEKTIYRWIKAGRLPGYLINEQYRFNRAELLEWATARKINVSPELFSEPDEGARTSLPEVAEALENGGIHYRVAGTDKSSVLKAVVDLMRLPDEVDRGFLHQVLLARESLGSTGVGDGIAIPHVRNPIVLHVPLPTVTLCFLEHPIDFDAIDGKPVDTLFTIVSPTVRAHLHILSRLVYTLRDPRLRGLLARPASRPEIIDAVRAVEAQASPEPGAS
ncbi:MAG: PTS sugar transporter subunit IIA [Candidatus Krumholzibacteriia bacterium]